ncbi:MAG TPA: MFS transporter [Gaiellaceae bacterium]|jgi:MFS family permease|nr:MFS transporter [Gaiellaceae bacterium]
MTAAADPGRWRTFASLRKHRNYRLFFTGQIVSVSGTWMQDAALPWLVLSLTHSPLDVGLLIVCRSVPFAFLGLSAGVLADRFDNRRFMIVTEAVSAVIALLLAIVSLSGDPPLWQIYTLAILGGTALAFESPNRNALTFRMVGRDELPNAIALNSSLFNTGRMVGPAVGGVLIATAGVSACFAINSLSYLAVLISLLLMRTAELFPLDRGDTPLETRGAIRAGLRFALGSRRITMVLLIAFVVTLVGFNFRVLIPVLTSKTLHAGPEAFGVLWAFFGGGSLVGALYTANLREATWKSLFVGVFGFSVSMLAIAPLGTVPPVAVLLAVAGFCTTMWLATSQTILQISTPDAFRGRVLSMYVLVLVGVAPLGGLLTAWLSEVGGTELAFGVAGTVGVAVAGLAWLRLRGEQERAPSAPVAPSRAIP